MKRLLPFFLAISVLASLSASAFARPLESPFVVCAAMAGMGNYPPTICAKDGFRVSGTEFADEFQKFLNGKYYDQYIGTGASYSLQKEKGKGVWNITRNGNNENMFYTILGYDESHPNENLKGVNFTWWGTEDEYSSRKEHVKEVMTAMLALCSSKYSTADDAGEKVSSMLKAANTVPGETVWEQNKVDKNREYSLTVVNTVLEKPSVLIMFSCRSTV